MKCHFATAVWGEAYTDLFVNVSLPSQLSAGNLPAFADRDQCVYAIYTTARDAQTIRQSPAYAILADTLPTAIVPVDDVDLDGDKYRAMSECHRRALAASDAEGAAIVLLSPDAVWSDRSFAVLSRAAAAGKRAVMVAGIRVVKETFVEPVLQQFGGENRGILTVPARGLVRTAMEHLHPISQALLWGGAEHSSWPSHLYWSVPGEGLIARCFHLHPLLVKPAARGVTFATTVDGDWICRACRNPREVYVVSDSDELMVCELSQRSQTVGEVLPGPADVEQVSGWAARHTNVLHRSFAQHRIRLHSNGLSPRWRAVEASSDRVMAEVLGTVRRRLIWNAWSARAGTLRSAAKGVLRRVPGARTLARAVRSAAQRFHGN